MCIVSQAEPQATVHSSLKCSIVFIDEIDKIVGGGSGRSVGSGVSSEGVQRDLLPIIEGEHTYLFIQHVIEV